jgi:hypothetical protein
MSAQFLELFFKGGHLELGITLAFRIKAFDLEYGALVNEACEDS